MTATPFIRQQRKSACYVTQVPKACGHVAVPLVKGSGMNPNKIKIVPTLHRHYEPTYHESVIQHQKFTPFDAQQRQEEHQVGQYR